MGRAWPAKPITARRLLLVEGEDEVNFLQALLHHEEITGVAVREVGGKDQFPARFDFLKNDGAFHRLEALGVVRDADADAAGTFQSVTGILRRNALPVPQEIGAFTQGGHLRVGVFVMPGGQASGMLEDLCLRTVADHPVTACVEEYVACLEGRQVEPANGSKCRAYAFLAAMKEPVARVGIGAQRGYWNLDHPALGELRAFLTRLAS